MTNLELRLLVIAPLVLAACPTPRNTPLQGADGGGAIVAADARIPIVPGVMGKLDPSDGSTGAGGSGGNGVSSDGPSAPPGACQRGDRHCGAGQAPESCDDHGGWIPETPCPNVCLGAGACGGDCKPDTTRCGGVNQLTVETCDRTGKWVPGTVCMNLCSSGSCGGSCMPSAVRCGANQTREVCSPMGTWEPDPAPCPFICTAGACGGICKPGSRRCGSNAVQTCAADASAWTDSMDCPFGCDPARNACIACSPMQGQSCFDSACETGTIDCSGNCAHKSKPNGTTCGPAFCNGGAGDQEASTCQSGNCQPGRTCDYHGCGANQKCSSTCPKSAPFDTGSSCQLCGGNHQQCCNDTCPNGSGLVCFQNNCQTKNPNGVGCGNRDDLCQSGHCTSGVCCPLCTGPNQKCDATGTCVTTCGLAGLPCCSGLSCSNSSLVCYDYPTYNVCDPKIADGSGCDADRFCQSGHCDLTSRTCVRP